MSYRKSLTVEGNVRGKIFFSGKFISELKGTENIVIDLRGFIAFYKILSPPFSSHLLVYFNNTDEIRSESKQPRCKLSLY